MRSWIAGVLMVLAFVIAPAPAAAEGDTQKAHSVIGRVRDLDPHARTFRIGDNGYYVPPGVAGLGHVSVGSIVSVRYEEIDDQNVASSIRKMD